MHLWLERYKKFKSFVGPEVWRFFVLAIVLGFGWFLIETSFVVVFPGYLSAMGLLDGAHLLPAWYPKDAQIATVCLIVFGIIRGLLLLLRNYASVRTSQAFIRYQKSTILKYALAAQNKESSHNVVTIFNDHVGKAGLALERISYLICNSITTVLFIAFGLKVAPIELIIGLGLIGIAALPLRLLNAKSKIAGESIHHETEVINKILLVGLRNNFFLTLYRLIDAEVKRGQKALVSYERHTRNFHFMMSLRGALPLTIGTIVVGVVTFVSMNSIHTPPATLLAFFYIFVRIAQNISDNMSVLGELRLHAPVFQSLYHWYLKAQPANIAFDQRPVHTADTTLSSVHIDVKNLNFSFEDKKIIDDLSFKIGPSDIFLIKGRTGAGKSTLLSLILGLLKPSSGQVLVNQKPASEVIGSMTERLGYVGPDPYLIPGTIRENLLYGLADDKQVTDEEIWTSLRMAHVDDEIRKLPQTLDEYMYEWAQLSTGQRQRLAIARALLRKPVLLVFDEATANVDEETEKKLVAVIESLKPNRTILIVSHKHSFDAVATKHLNLQKV